MNMRSISDLDENLIDLQAHKLHERVKYFLLQRFARTFLQVYFKEWNQKLAEILAIEQVKAMGSVRLQGY